MTTIEQRDVVATAFAVDLKAIATAEAVAASVAAGETPRNIREVCRAVGWGEGRLEEEVHRHRQMIIAKATIAAEAQALPRRPKVDAEIKAENLRYYGELKKEHLARLQPLLQSELDLRRVCDQAIRPRQMLRDELLPRHVHEQIKAIEEQIAPVNAQRSRLEDEIHKLQLKIPEDVAYMARIEVAGGRAKYRKEIARKNEERDSTRRKSEQQLKKIKEQMEALLDREEQLRSTYVSACPSYPPQLEQ